MRLPEPLSNCGAALVLGRLEGAVMGLDSTLTGTEARAHLLAVRDAALDEAARLFPVTA